jgi:hypothetical protein
VPVGAEVAAMAECDGQHLGLLPPPVVNQSATVHQSATVNQSAGGCADPVPSGRRRSAHTGVRAKQTVTPATRRTVLRRDHHRCTVPGCKNAVFIDVHHIELRSESGLNEADKPRTCNVRLANQRSTGLARSRRLVSRHDASIARDARWVQDCGDPRTRGTTGSGEAPKPFLSAKTVDPILASVDRFCARTIEQATSWPIHGLSTLARSPTRFEFGRSAVTRPRR